MLKGKDLGQAIDRAIALKIKSGKIRSKADVARHFGIRTPSIYDWIKKGSISKDKLPELWRYFSDVVGPGHWGLNEWPMVEEAEYPPYFAPPSTPVGRHAIVKTDTGPLPPELKQHIDEIIRLWAAGKLSNNKLGLLIKLASPDEPPGEAGKS